MSIELLDESELIAALALLFSTDKDQCGTLLRSIRESELRKAYRRKALQTHPDMFMARGEECRRMCSERFIQVNNAYEALSGYLKSRDVIGGDQTRRDYARDYAQTGTSAGYSRQAYARRDNSRDTSGRERFHGFASSSFWGRDVPRRHLRFGEFLYYSGIVPWRVWIRALVRQGTQRPRIGEIAKKWRWVTEMQIEHLLGQRRPGELLGELFLNNRIVNPFQLNVLLRRQKNLQRPIGSYFVQLGAIRKGELGSLLKRQLHHNARYR